MNDSGFSGKDYKIMPHTFYKSCTKYPPNNIIMIRHRRKTSCMARRVPPGGGGLGGRTPPPPPMCVFWEKKPHPLVIFFFFFFFLINFFFLYQWPDLKKLTPTEQNVKFSRPKKVSSYPPPPPPPPHPPPPPPPACSEAGWVVARFPARFKNVKPPPPPPPVWKIPAYACAWLIVYETELSLLSILLVLLRQAASENELLKSNYGNASITLNKQNFVIPCSFLLIEVSYEGAETELSRNVIFSLKFRYRPPNDILVSSRQIVFNHS